MNRDEANYKVLHVYDDVISSQYWWRHVAKMSESLYNKRFIIGYDKVTCINDLLNGLLPESIVTSIETYGVP